MVSKVKYEEYLQSDHWKAFASSIRTSRKVCNDCGLHEMQSRRWLGQSLNVHHLTYERIGKEKPEDVVVLCLRCHLNRHQPESKLGDVIVQLAELKKMPEIGEGSRQVCASCGVFGGLTYFNVDEDLPEWLCGDCRS